MSGWLVVGAGGQLGTDMTDLLRDRGAAVVSVDYPEIDITDPESCRRIIDLHRPEILVNAAAFTAVDAAESQESAAVAVNGFGPRHLAESLASVPGARMVQVSTDYVFSGTAAGPRPEDAEPDPVSVYGRSKLLGEQAIRRALPGRSWVVRTAWLYSVSGANFVRTMLDLADQRETLHVVDDQHGQPTWSRDLGERIIDMIDRDVPAGIYHGTNSGETTWFGFAREVFRRAGLDPERVQPTTTDRFPRPAPRPPNSVLGHDRWAHVGMPAMRPWAEALGQAMPAILQSRAPHT